MAREEEIDKAATAYVHSNVGYTDHWGYEFYDAFKAGVEWSDKHPDINFVFLTGFEAAQEDIISKLQSLVKEWSYRDSSEAKYRLEAYKELLEFIKE